MISRRSLYLKHIAQTAEDGHFVDIAYGKGIYLYDTDGHRHIDMSSGIGPSILGHRHSVVDMAIKVQSEAYLHTMVYGRHIQSPQLSLAERLISHTPDNLNQVYFLSSGSEAVEAALKIARLSTDRYKIISAANAYHGSTIGAESLRSDIDFTTGIAPLVPGIEHIRFNHKTDLEKIDHRTAAVIMETIQAEAGVLTPSVEYMHALRKKCDEVGALLILDEIQVGLGRTGRLFAFEHFEIRPDVLVLGKAIGGGLPLSAVISERSIMSSISVKFPLAHITTFGGHPLCCATGLATLDYILEHRLWERSEEIGERLTSRLAEKGPWQMSRAGSMIAFDMGTSELAVDWYLRLYQSRIITDLLLFKPSAWRIAPPLIISDQEIDSVADQILKCVEM